MQKYLCGNFTIKSELAKASCTIHGVQTNWNGINEHKQVCCRL